jgi:hypothetical protein
LLLYLGCWHFSLNSRNFIVTSDRLWSTLWLLRVRIIVDYKLVEVNLSVGGFLLLHLHALGHLSTIKLFDWLASGILLLELFVLVLVCNELPNFLSQLIFPMLITKLDTEIDTSCKVE